MKTTRRARVIQNVGKAISSNSANSKVNNGDSEAQGFLGKSLKARDMEMEALSTKFTDVTSVKEGRSQSSPSSTDIEMDMDVDTGFSFDSIMASESESTHSKVLKEYGSELVSNLKKREFTMSGDLENHEIKGTHRKQMVVWMEEVLRIFKCPTETFFHAVHIMDRYLDSERKSLVLAELHEIGIVSMFIASKYQEIEPLTLELMVSKVAHGKITSEQILAREKLILSNLKFRLSKPTVNTFIENYLEVFSSRIGSEDMKPIKTLAVQIAKNGISDRRTAFTVLPSEVALCSIILAVKSHSKAVGKSILTTDFSTAIKIELTSDEAIVLQIGKRLRKLSLEQIF